MKRLFPYQLTRPPRALHRARLDSIALVPASLLFHKPKYKAIAKTLPQGSVLICTPLQEKQRQALEFVPHGSVALTGSILETGAILNGHNTSLVVDQAGPMQESRSQRDRTAGRAQHLSEKAMRQQETVRSHSIPTGQQPARKPFLDSVQPVTDGGL